MRTFARAKLIPWVRDTFREAGYTRKTEGARTDRPLGQEQAAPGLWWGRDGGYTLSTHRLGIYLSDKGSREASLQRAGFRLQC